MDKKTGFVKRPTFAELAKLEQKVTYSKPIVRDAAAYWNSLAVTLRVWRRALGR